MSFLHQLAHSLRQAAEHRLRKWTRPENHGPVLNAALDLTRCRSELVMENALLRQQLIVLERQITRPQLTWRDRTLIVLLASKLRRWKEALIIVQPDTVLRWHRDLFRRYWRRKSKSPAQCGRPPLTEDVVALIRQMARENATWGAERIRGELRKVGVEVSKSSIQKYMAGVCNHRASKQTWATFLRNHPSPIITKTNAVWKKRS